MVTAQAALGPDDLPLLGEPLAVELANSLYISNGISTDYIATAQLLSLWATHVRCEPPLGPLRGLRKSDVQATRDLRDAVRELLNALASGAPAPRAAIHSINGYAAAAATSVALAQDAAGRLLVHTRYAGRSTIDAFLGRLAIETIVLAAGLVPAQLRRCEGPGCAMLFVRTHHRRQWCHASCGHRARQAAYYRRKSSTRGRGASHP